MKIKKIVSILLLILILINSLYGVVSAVEISSANIENLGKCENHLQFVDPKTGQWSDIITTMVGYRHNGVLHYAYCLNVDKHGVGEVEGYTVNVSQILSDPAVWRAVINGFPYKSASELGVANDQDAFVATKQAIYSVIYDRDVDSFYRGGDERGNQIFNALKNIVNTARSGTQTPSDSGINVNKIGEFKADFDDYYSQEYSVSSNAEMSNYTVTGISNFPEGSQVVGMDNSARTSFSGEEHFKVIVPKDKVVNNFDGKVTVSGSVKSYPVFLGESPNSSWQNYALTYDAFVNVNGESTVSVDTYKSKIKLLKIDAETSKPIEGVTFQLQKLDGTVVANSTTNEDGVASFSQLLPGEYILKEIETNKDYVLNESNFDITVEYGQTVNKTITNEHKRGNLKVVKVDKDNHKVTLGNVEFDLYSEEFQRVIGTYTTNVDGEIFVNNLRTGNYKLIEKNTGKWYNLADEVSVEVKWNDTEESVVENELKKGQVKVIKIDKDDNTIKLEGVKFDVLDENGNVLETIITNENGEALTSKYAIRDFSKLTIREKETLQNYVLNQEPQDVTIEEDKINEVVFENELKKGQIRVIKVDEDNNEVRLQGVEFKVYDEDGNLVDTLITDENGECISKKLRIDKEYKVVETKNLDNYVLNEIPQTVTLTHNQITNITFTNELKKGQIRVIKVDKDNNEIRLQGVEFKVYDEDGNLVDTLITDENGECVSKRLRIDKKYNVVESKTLDNYVLNETPQIVKLEQDKITDAVFENELIKGYIKIIKESNEDNPCNGDVKGTKLPNAKFEVYNEKDELVDTLITDENGEAITKELVKGKYTIKEVESPNYYLLTDEIFEVEIVKHQETVDVNISNTPEKPEVDIEKTGIIQTTANEEIRYDFKIKNTGNVALDHFTWIDYLPSDYVRMGKLITGTYNQDLNYNIYYKTNLNDYRLLVENLNTQTNNYIDFTNIQLEEDEVITEFKADFGTVNVGFESVIDPYIFVTVNDTVKNDDTFTNRTRIEGNNKGYFVWDEDDHTTKIYEKELKIKLPRTGC